MKLTTLTHGAWLWHLWSMWQQQAKIMVCKMWILIVVSAIALLNCTMSCERSDQKEMLKEFWYDCGLLLRNWNKWVQIEICMLIGQFPLKEQFSFSYWVCGLCSSSRILNTRKHNVLKTRSVSVLRWEEGHLLCWSLRKSQSQSLDKVQNLNNSECYTLLWESFSFYQQIRVLPLNIIPWSWFGAMISKPLISLCQLITL
jgi:hypothetical protein